MSSSSSEENFFVLIIIANMKKRKQYKFKEGNIPSSYFIVIILFRYMDLHYKMTRLKINSLLNKIKN